MIIFIPLLLEVAGAGAAGYAGRKVYKFYKEVQEREKERERKENIDYGMRMANNANAKKLADLLEKNDTNKVAYFALGVYVAGLDGIADEEVEVIKKKVGDPNSNLIPNPLREKFKAIYEDIPSFNTIKIKYLEAVQTEFLVELNEYINEIILSDQVISEAEKKFLLYEWYPYLESRGIEVKSDYYNDYKELIIKERKQIENDRVEAANLYNEGWRYENGDGVVKDIERARNLYKKAAEMGNMTAKSRLNYLEILGLTNSSEALEEKQNPEEKEFARLLKNADSGDATAMYEIGRAFEFCKLGKGKSLHAARNWYKKAVDRGNTDAVFRLEEVQKQLDFEVQKSKGKLKREDEYDDPSQLYNKGWRYENGDGVPKDIEYAKILYKTAASRGNRMAKARLNYLNSMS